MVRLKIKNCRNIASIDEDGIDSLLFDERKLNVLYGPNGVGKTTVVKAVRYAAERDNSEELYESLKSFECIKGGSGSELLPFAELSDGQELKCLIFDGDWIKNHYFKSDDAIADGAYRLCVDESKLMTLRRERDGLCFELNAALVSDVLPLAVEAAARMSKAAGAGKTDYSSSSKMAATLKNGGTLSGLPLMLESVVPKEPTRKAEWASWHFKGLGFLSTNGAKCPYCGAEGMCVKDAASFDERHDSNQADAWLEMISILDGDTSVFAPESISTLRKTLVDGTGDQDDLVVTKSFMTSLAKAAAAYKQLAAIPEMPLEGPTAPTKRTLNNCSEVLRSVSGAFSPKVKALLVAVADKTDALGDSIDKVRSIDEEWQKELKHHAAQYREQMSRFLEAAGYPYEIAIKDANKGKASLILVHRSTGIPVEGASSTLSYGEQNALSLALFYSEAIKNKEALIILDDPISSFDGMKRFALLSALFSPRNNKLLNSSLNGRFVILLTHDPLVVHDSLRFLATRRATSAKFLFTGDDGVMKAKRIGIRDFQPYAKLVKDRIAAYARKSTDPLPFCALVYIRQWFELSRKHTTFELCELVESDYTVDDAFRCNYSDALAFALLSSLLHGDAKPKLCREGDGAGRIDMPPDMIGVAEEAVGALLESCGADVAFDSKSYIHLFEERPPSYLTSSYIETDTSPYERVLLLRALLDLDGDNADCMDPYHEYVLNSAFHLGGDLVMQLNRDEFCLVPSHIQKVCDEAYKVYMAKYEE